MSSQSSLSSPLLIAGQDLLSDSATQYHRLGAYAETPDGRGFRYALIGGTSSVAGQLYQAAAENTSNERNLSIAAAAIGATQVVTTSTMTTTANQYDNGYLFVTNGTGPGQGFTYVIKNHSVVSGAVATFNLNDPLVVALTTSSKIGVFPHPYAKVVVAPTTATSMPVGVANSIITNANYGWLQTHGACSCLVQGTVTVGNSLIPASSTNAGSIAVATNGVASPIGYAIGAGTSTEYPLVFLTID